MPPLAPRRLAVTGATGFIGSALVATLRGEGHTVLFKMRTICPNLREVLSSDRGTSSTTGPRPWETTSGYSLM